jgi:hypothetical protein
MKPEDILNDAFLKQFKSGTELTTFLEDLHKRGVEKNIRRRIRRTFRL